MKEFRFAVNGQLLSRADTWTVLITIILTIIPLILTILCFILAKSGEPI